MLGQVLACQISIGAVSEGMRSVPFATRRRRGSSCSFIPCPGAVHASSPGRPGLPESALQIGGGGSTDAIADQVFEGSVLQEMKRKLGAQTCLC